MTDGIVKTLKIGQSAAKYLILNPLLRHKIVSGKDRY
jgi:hypothetical protein